MKLTLQLGGTVLVKLLLVNSISESQRIEESGGGNNSKLVLESLNGSRGASLLDRGESSGGTGGGSEDGELHHLGKLTLRILWRNLFTMLADKASSKEVLEISYLFLCNYNGRSRVKDRELTLQESSHSLQEKAQYPRMRPVRRTLWRLAIF